MDFLGIGPLELFLIIIIALIVLGPKDMVKAGRTIGTYLRKIVTHPSWQVVQRTSKDLKNLPNKLIKDAGIDEDFRDIQSILPDGKLDIPSWDSLLEGDKSNEKSEPPISNTQTEKEMKEWVTPPSAQDTKNQNIASDPEID
jgi:Sec-independent protein translocase protein TatA